MKITLAQLNSIVGDIWGNVKKMEKAIKIASKNKSDLIIFSEMFITGYPPRDLLEKDKFIQETQKALTSIKKISKHFPKIGILFGTVSLTNKKKGNGLYNSAFLIYQGRIVGQQHKTLLPTYDVFDEARHFDSSPEIKPIPFKKEKLGVSICEDMWSVPGLYLKKQYKVNPIKSLAEKGATLLINLSASPFSVGKDKIRYQIIQAHVAKYHLPFIHVNSIGGNDELIFDGNSLALDQQGNLIERLPGFREQVKTFSLKINNKSKIFIPADKITSVYQALILGTKDYVEKCGFKKIVLGLSGGIDSAITCCLAVKALGKENVLGITMPSMYSSKGSVDYSQKLAKNLGIRIKKIPINQIYDSYLSVLKGHLKSQTVETTQENIQARIRGNILMAISNKFGHLVLSTGNKSELAVGYCTLYGDMSGGLSVISDVPKTMVYKLAEYINQKKEIIPQESIKAKPSAELKPDQYDQDTLPPYEILDPILEFYIDKNYSAEKIIAQGFNSQVVKWVIQMVNRNEYKRKQAAPGLRITSKAFGMGRRIPVAAKYQI